MNVTEKNNGGGGSSVFEALASSKIYQEYEQAFTEATGLPLALRPVDSWQLPHHGRRNEAALCAAMAGTSKSCAACLRIQGRLAKGAERGPASATCELGLCDSAVPVRLGGQLIGLLQTGQYFQNQPTGGQFEAAADTARGWGVACTREQLKDAYFGAKVLSPKQHDSVLKLLEIFAQHLSLVSNQIAIQQENSEPPVIRRAKEFINANYGSQLSLGVVAKAVNTSTFYFCKLFKKSTGIHFTEHLSRVRVEKAKNLLMNPNLRVSEVAYEVGFQSLTHFNRVFKKLTGQSPTEFRGQLAK